MSSAISNIPLGITLKFKPVKIIRQIILLFTLACMLFACASPQPVLYHNQYYKSMGEKKANEDIVAAMKDADSQDINSKWEEQAKNTGKDVAVGTAGGTVSGLLLGQTWLGVVAGAVAGFFVGFVSWMFDSTEPTPLYKRYVDKTLQDQGYEVIGWK